MFSLYANGFTPNVATAKVAVQPAESPASQTARDAVLMLKAYGSWSAQFELACLAHKRADDVANNHPGPADDLAEIHRLMALPSGDVPSTY